MTEPDQTRNWKAGRPMMLSADNRQHGFRAGWISTEYGLVGFYSQVGERPMTHLDIVSEGRHLSIIFNRTFTDRYLKTLATRFALQHQGEAERG